MVYLYPNIILMNQSSVTGEHTCMVVKPLNNDDVESSGVDHWGFFSPFYEGGSIILSTTLFCLDNFSVCRLIYVDHPQILGGDL